MIFAVPQVIFQVALTILDNNKKELLNCKDDGEAMPILSSYLENVGNRDTTMPTVAHTTQLGTNTKKEVKFIVACKATYSVLIYFSLFNSVTSPLSNMNKGSYTRKQHMVQVGVELVPEKQS